MNKFNNFKFWVNKNSPEILISVGIINMAASIVLACLATKRVTQITGPVKMNAIKIHKKIDDLNDNDPKKEELNNRLKKMYFKTGRKIALLYAPTVFSFALSVLCIIGSHKILKGRNIAITAAFTTLKTSYDAYRERVREKLGNDKEQEIFESNSTEKIVELDDTGKKIKVIKHTPNSESEDSNGFSVCWDSRQKSFDPRSGGLNLTFLLQAEEWFNQKLRSTGYVFLHEIYEYLRFSPAYLGPRRLQASRVLGWIYSPNDNTRDNYISFGIHDKDGKLTSGAQKLQNGLEDFIWLTFNYDGDILTEDKGKQAFMRLAINKG